jgi:hypothetical protein
MPIGLYRLAFFLNVKWIVEHLLSGMTSDSLLALIAQGCKAADESLF